MNNKKPLSFLLKAIGLFLVFSVPLYHPSKTVVLILVIPGVSLLSIADLIEENLPKRIALLKFCYFTFVLVLGIIYNNPTKWLVLTGFLIIGLWLIDKYLKIGIKVPPPLNPAGTESRRKDTQ